MPVYNDISPSISHSTMASGLAGRPSFAWALASGPLRQGSPIEGNIDNLWGSWCLSMDHLVFMMVYDGLWWFIIVYGLSISIVLLSRIKLLGKLRFPSGIPQRKPWFLGTNTSFRCSPPHPDVQRIWEGGSCTIEAAWRFMGDLVIERRHWKSKNVVNRLTPIWRVYTNHFRWNWV